MKEATVNVNDLTNMELYDLYKIIEEYLEYLNKENEKVDEKTDEKE